MCWVVADIVRKKKYVEKRRQKMYRKATRPALQTQSVENIYVAGAGASAGAGGDRYSTRISFY